MNRMRTPMIGSLSLFFCKCCTFYHRFANFNPIGSLLLSDHFADWGICWGHHERSCLAAVSPSMAAFTDR